MKFLKRETRPGMIEYALVFVLVVATLIGVLTLLGPQIGNVFSRVTCTLSAILLAPRVLPWPTG
jgi:Flp pilus assembly pilin Flp